jgi:hypothetical protein
MEENEKLAPIKKGRARKATTTKRPTKTVYTNVEEVKASSDDENVVLNLKVYQDLDSTDNNIEPYNTEGFVNGSSDMFLDNVFDNIENQSQLLPIPETHTPDRIPSLKVIELLKDFEEKNKHNEWPSNTSIHCYWCCHKFNNTPVGLPIKYANNRFYVFGCFCSLECCAAFNLDSKDCGDDIWERNSLINMLSNRLGYKSIIKPAPSRLALKIFGGHMDIPEFRGFTNSNKVININFPPMSTLTQQIEEINETDINNDYRFIPLDNQRINTYKEKLKLKRTKPLTNFKNTLDHTMNLKYGH